MLDNINYEIIFNEPYESIPKCIKGDYIGIQEIKLSKNKLYAPKNSRNTSLNGNNPNLIISTTEKKDNIDSNTNTNTNTNTIKLKEEKNYKYCISTVSNNLIYFPNKDYYTDDKDLKQLVDLFNEPTTKDFGYSNVIDEENCKVYKRMVEGYPVILIKCLAHMPYSKDVVFEAIANLEIRKQWDSVFSELRVVNYEGENGAEILFMIVKSPVFIISNREFVQQRKMWKNFPTDKSHILHFISVENHECPPNKKNVRAETIISGYYMQDDPHDPGKSILGVLSQTDLKGNIPHVLVNKFAPKSSRGWVKSLYKGCEIVTQKMKNNI